MRKLRVGILLAFTLLAAIAGTTSAQFGAGAKLSQVMEIFGAYHVSEDLMLEIGVPLGFSGLVFALNANAKLYFHTLPVTPEVPLRLFIGAGASLLSVLGTLSVNPRGLAGVEYQLQHTGLHLFADVSVGLVVSSLGLAAGVAPALGVRYDF